MEKVKPIRFVNPTQSEFVKTLRKRVDNYFKEKNIPKTGGIKFKIKAVVMLAMYTAPYFVLLSGAVTSSLIQWGLCVLMGLGMAGIGLSVMHDANHGSASRKKWLNKFLGFSINFLGGNINNWKAQHNIMHHSFTNIEGHDEDLNAGPVLRFSPKSRKLKMHKYQHIYAWFLYSLMTLSWTFQKDFGDILRYEKMGLLKQLKTTLRKEMILIIVTRVIYFIYMLVIPFLLMDAVWWQLIIGFLTVHFAAGFTLASIFQLAHVMEELEYPIPTEGSILNQWAVHQMNTTLNFAGKDKLLSWYVGGLNYQVEHHLFPNISHVHYSKIAPIVEKTAKEFNVPYHNVLSFRSALAQHGRMLYKLGHQEV
ncbi:acyl-CoA desaturase [Vicingaceae bacterium]|nr:acyl-CoA desaturase [Vicingaceae bacterium]